MKQQLKEKIMLPDTITIKFAVDGTLKEGGKFGSQIINPDTENEDYKKQILTNSVSCDMWIFSHTIGEMDKIKKAIKISDEMRDFKLLSFSIPKKVAYTKLPDKETILDKAKKNISLAFEKDEYPFEVELVVLGKNEVFMFSNKNAKSK